MMVVLFILYSPTLNGMCNFEVIIDN